MIDQAKRDAIISESAKWFTYDGAKIESAQDLFCATSPVYGGGIALFSYLSLATLEKLVSEGFANLRNAQNNSPTLKEFLEFMRQYPIFTANGYAVEAERDDCRVTITGLECKGVCSPEAAAAFLKFAESADEKKVKKDSLFCWWD